MDGWLGPVCHSRSYRCRILNNRSWVDLNLLVVRVVVGMRETDNAQRGWAVVAASGWLTEISKLIVTLWAPRHAPASSWASSQLHTVTCPLALLQLIKADTQDLIIAFISGTGRLGGSKGTELVLRSTCDTSSQYYGSTVWNGVWCYKSDLWSQ